MISLRQVKESHIFPRATKHLAVDSIRRALPINILNALFIC
jgi:hypothetical protein